MNPFKNFADLFLHRSKASHHIFRVFLPSHQSGPTVRLVLHTQCKSSTRVEEWGGEEVNALSLLLLQEATYTTSK